MQRLRGLTFIFLLLFFAGASYAGISTTTKYIDNNFDNPQVFYPIDLDKDGDTDVVAAASNADGTVDIAWWENDGTNDAFTERSVATDFNEANYVTVVDLDFDGDLDILATAGGATDDIAWWANDGTPSDGGWTKYTIDASFDGADSVFPIDIDKDGDIDIAASGNTADDIAWWVNDGNPKKDNWTTKYTVDGSFDGATSIFVLDMDFDGDLDILAAADTDDDIAWWVNDGNPKKDNWTTKYTINGSFDGVNAVYPVDMDFDGDPDIVATALNDDDIAWWVNDGDPKKSNWTTKYTIDASFDGVNSFFVRDIDFDGDLDVAASAGVADDIAWWENDGDPKKNNWTKRAVKEDFDGAAFIYPFDFDRDGDMDFMACADTDDDIAWWKNNADLQSGKIGYAAEHAVDTSFFGAKAVAAADIDLDGNIDILGAARTANDITWWESDGTPLDGGWTKHIVDADLDGAYDIFPIDLDRDGDIDIVAAGHDADDLVWYNNDDSQNFTKTTIDGNFNGVVSIFAVDLDDDGDRDIAAAAYFADEVAWWKNNGSQAFTKASIDSACDGASSVFIVDLDRDGDKDILVTAEINDDVLWYQNDGSENFTKKKIDDDLDGAASAKAMDLDLDGDIDVAACGKQNNDINWYKNDGTPSDGGWTEYLIVGDFNGANHIGLLDLDMDGDTDILASAQTDDDIAWWENDRTPSDGGWVKHVVDSSFDGAASLAASDIDRDAYIDILGAAENDNLITWWENGGAAAATTPTQTESGATPFIDVDFTTLEGPAAAKTATPAATGTPVPTTASKAEQEVDVSCFIATASYGTPWASEVRRLCRFRDNYLMRTRAGRAVVSLYYKVSPPIAYIISRNSALKSAVRWVIEQLLKIIPSDTAAAQEAPAQKRGFTVGIIMLDPPEEYVITEDTKTHKRRIYKKDNFDINKHKNLTVSESAVVDTIEYRYEPASGRVDFAESEFELTEINGKTAVLKKDYFEGSAPATQGERMEIEPEWLPAEIELPEEIPLPEEAEKKTFPKRLVSEYFNKIETKKLSDTEWEVTLPTLLDAAGNFTEALSAVTDKVAKLIDPEKTSKLYFKTSIGKASLDATGLAIESLGGGLKTKCGLKVGDLIKSVNGKSLATIQDIASIFSTFSSAPQTVTVKFLRGDSELTHTYYIK